MFGKNSGRQYSASSPQDANGSWDTKFSIAAFEIQASALLGHDPARIQKIADQIREFYLFYLLTNPNIKDAISKTTADTETVRLRWVGFKASITPLLEGIVLKPRFFDYSFRKQLYQSSPICALCSNRILTEEDSTVDHIIPHAAGGDTVPENAQLAHRLCNAKKSAAVGQVGLPGPGVTLRGDSVTIT